MLSIFRSNFVGIQVLLLGYASVLHLAHLIGYVSHPNQEVHTGYLFQSSFGWMDPQGLWARILAFVFIWVQAVLLNQIAIKYKLTERKTWFIGLAYVLLTALLPTWQSFSAALITNFFMLAVLDNLFATYRVADCRKEIFNVGFFLSLGALFSPDYLWYAIPIFFSISALRKFAFSEQFLYLIGVVSPFLMVGAFAYLGDHLDTFLSTLNFRIFGLPFWMKTIDRFTTVGLITVSVLVLVVLLGSFTVLSKIGLQQRKYLNICYWLLVSGVIITIFQPTPQLSVWYRGILPLAILLGLLLENQKRLIIPELIHVLLMAAILFSQYFLRLQI